MREKHVRPQSPRPTYAILCCWSVWPASSRDPTGSVTMLSIVSSIVPSHALSLSPRRNVFIFSQKSEGYYYSFAHLVRKSACTALRVYAYRAKRRQSRPGRQSENVDNNEETPKRGRGFLRDGSSGTAGAALRGPVRQAAAHAGTAGGPWPGRVLGGPVGFQKPDSVIALRVILPL